LSAESVLLTVEGMQNKLTGFMGALAIGGVLAAGAMWGGCEEDNDTGVVATAGRGGTTGAGGAAGNTATFNMQLTGAQEVPANNSTATANVTVTLNRTTGAVTVSGTFGTLSSPATVAHIHGPAGVGQNAPALIPLTLPSTTTGDVTGTGTMSQVQMNDMMGGMTYVNIHSENFPDGEIRAQIVP